MSITEILATQLTDPFRIGLLVVLALTTARTAHATGRVVPLALGLAFVAVLIPTAMPTQAAGLPWQIGIGVVANAVILAVVLALAALAGRVLARS